MQASSFKYEQRCVIQLSFEGLLDLQADLCSLFLGLKCLLFVFLQSANGFLDGDSILTFVKTAVVFCGCAFALLFVCLPSLLNFGHSKIHFINKDLGQGVSFHYRVLLLARLESAEGGAETGGTLQLVGRMLILKAHVTNISCQALSIDSTSKLVIAAHVGAEKRSLRALIDQMVF